MIKISRSIRSQMLLNIGDLKIFGNFTGKRLRWSLFKIKLQVFKPVILSKRDSNTGVFLSNYRNFKNTFLIENLRSLLLNIMFERKNNNRKTLAKHVT